MNFMVMLQTHPVTIHSEDISMKMLIMRINLVDHTKQKFILIIDKIRDRLITLLDNASRGLCVGLFIYYDTQTVYYVPAQLSPVTTPLTIFT